MEIGNANFIPAETYTPTAVERRTLTQEIEDTGTEKQSSIKISGEGIYLSELAARGVENPKRPKLSQASLRKMEFDIELMRTMKTKRIAGESSGNDLKDLTAAYDEVRQNINPNSQNDNKHVKHLDASFSDLSRLFLFRDNTRETRNAHFQEEMNGTAKPWDAVSESTKAWETADHQSNLFTEAFLKNYKRYGALTAFEMAFKSIK